MRTLKPLFAIPSSLNPFEFYVLTNDGNKIRGYLYNVLGKTEKKERIYPPVPDEYVKLALQSPVFRDMKHILRKVYITDFSKNAEGSTIVAEDIAVRNFGGRFGRTTLKYDQNNRLIHETANI
jgi:hypothetical protein